MTQVWNVPQNAQNAKDVDYAFVIAGWPTIYTVAKNTYALGGDLSAANGFAPPNTATPLVTSNAWADVPDAIGSGAKGRPEEGSCTIAQIDVGVLDRVTNGKRALSDLLSRQAYLRVLTLTTNLSVSVPNGFQDPGGIHSLPVLSTSAFPNAGTIYVGLECIQYTSKTATTFDGCTRGFLGTSPTPHAGPTVPFGSDGARVYPFMPSLYGRKAFLYKGYQNLGFAQWVRAFGGVIGGVAKQGPKVTFTLFDNMWLTWANGGQILLGPPKDPTRASVFRSATLTNDLLPGDFDNVLIDVDDATNLGNGHYLLNLAGHWAAVTSVS